MGARNQAFCRGVLALWRATGSLDPYLSGDRDRKSRREVLTAIRGEKVKANECGTNAVREALLSSGGIAGLCPSAADSAFAELAATVILAEFPDIRCIVRGFRLLPEEGFFARSFALVAADSASAYIAANDQLRPDGTGWRHGLSPAPIPWGEAVEFDGENAFPA